MTDRAPARFFGVDRPPIDGRVHLRGSDDHHIAVCGVPTANPARPVRFRLELDEAVTCLTCRRAPPA